MTDRLVRPKEAAKILGCHVKTLDKWERAKIIPQRRSLSPRHVGWPESELQDLVRNGHGRGIGATSLLKKDPHS